jgi:hypothetical protein
MKVQINSNQIVNVINGETININDNNCKTHKSNKSDNVTKVFISYNHKDKVIVDKLITRLKNSGINVVYDDEIMKAGENIYQFIEQGMKDSDVTISVISNNSLLSSWVGIETINTFYLAKFSNKKIIACYVDDSFLNKNFRIVATKKIDIKINELNNLILKYMELKLDTSDLNNEKSRLYQLRNNLGEILQRLRNSLCIDIRKSVFNNSIERIISTIKE